MSLEVALPADHAAVVRDLDAQGFSVIEAAISREAAAAVKQRLWDVVAELERKGVATHTQILDRTPDNVRVYALPDHGPVFLELLAEPQVLAMVELALSGDFLASNFTANIARPGALPMKVHSDMALVIPEPWRERWALNVIWCLDDIHEANGATRYLPGSHLLAEMASLPADAEAQTVPFTAPAGAAIVMDGRLWHTSGRNLTRDSDRALLFAYYSRSFIRPQVNWHEVLRPEVIDALTERQRQLFGFGPLANTHGTALVRLDL